MTVISKHVMAGTQHGVVVIHRHGPTGKMRHRPLRQLFSNKRDHGQSIRPHAHNSPFLVARAREAPMIVFPRFRNQSMRAVKAWLIIIAFQTSLCRDQYMDNDTPVQSMVCATADRRSSRMRMLDDLIEVSATDGLGPLLQVSYCDRPNVVPYSGRVAGHRE
jgi:hypothetical protein